MPQENDQIVIAIIGGTIVLLILGSFIFYFLFLYQKRHNLYVDEVDRIKTQYQTDLLRTQLEIQELTLSHISQEIHDNIGQMLSVVKLQLGSIQSADQATINKLDTSFQILTKTIQDLRQLSRNLNTDYIEQKGFLHCVTEELGTIEQSGLLQTSLNVVGMEIKQSPQWELIVFRILQELLNNAIKHSKCKNLTIFISYQETALAAEISDDGCGFSTAVIPISNSLGLRSINKRVEVLGGRFTIQSAPGEGCSIFLSLPYAKN